MVFERRTEPYAGAVISTVENGIRYRVAPKYPDEPDGLALCEFQIGGAGWVPVRDLTAEEKAEYAAFILHQGTDEET